jgi:methylamine dehydrogenase accessory protein MauD
MTEALLVSNLVLWIAVLALAALVVALLRQIGVLYERIAPVGALATGALLRAGDAGPAVRAARLSGEPFLVGGPSADGRSTLLFFLSPTCPVCKTLLPVVKRVAGSEAGWLRVVLASDGPAEEHAEFVRETDLGGLPYVLGTELGLAYRVGKLPHAVLLDGAGIVRAQGLVNTREHLESLFEAQERGVASLDEYLHGRSPQQSEVA